MGFAEDKMWEYVKRHLDKIQELSLVDLLDQLAGCLTQPEIEGIQAKLNNDGTSRSAWTFVNSLRRRRNWVNEFIAALRKLERPDIADHYQDIYNGFQLQSQSQTSSIPSPSSLPAYPGPPPDRLNQDQCPPSYSSLGIIQMQALRYAPPAYLHEPDGSAAQALHLEPTIVDTSTESQLPPVQQALSSATATSTTESQFTHSQVEDFEETRTPTQESEPAGGTINTNLTHVTNSAAVGFQHEPHQTELTEAVSNPGSQKPKKGDYESRLSQEESDPQPNAVPTEDSSSTFTPFNMGRGRIPISQNTDRVVRRKELAGRNGAQNEPSDGHTAKVTETNTQILHPSPTPGPSNSRNTPVTALKSQIPRKAPQRRDISDATSPPAIRETPPRPVHPPARMQDKRPTDTGVQWREATRDSNEEDHQGLSKPGVLVSVQPNNSTTQSPALPEESPRSSMRTSRLAIDSSSDNSPHNESTPSRQRNEAHPSRNNEKTTDHRQELSGEPSNSSAFTVKSDPLMISKTPRPSMLYENKEPEEHGFLDRSQAVQRSTAEEPRDYLSDNNAAYTVSPSRNVPSECDDADSIDDTRRYEFHYSDNASFARDDSQNPDSSPNTIPSDGANSQGNRGNDDRNNNAVLPQMVIPVIAFALVGIFVLYRSR